MKQLAASIVGIFALGLALGSFVSSSSSVPELPERPERPELEDVELEAALESAPLVDCGEGREALLEPVRLHAKTSYKVRCVPTESVRRAIPTVTTASPSAEARAPSAPEAPEPIRTTTNEPNGPTENDGRSWKGSAVIIGGAAGAGAGIGAIAKGKKGAAVGAAIGAATGAAYELMKKDKQDKKN